MESVFVGIDVGTGSARAGVFDSRGELLSSAKRPIRIWRDGGDIVEQSSSDIWQAVCNSVKEAVAIANVAPEAVKGLGFDATCSLVVLDAEGRPLPVGPSGEDQRNIIVWMDHRAIEQAKRINATQHPVLRYLGGQISPEMQTPKLLWLKDNKPETFDRAAYFFDLGDFLSWRATGASERSVCTVTCKWTYLAHEKRWDPDYFRAIGLGALTENDFSRIGTTVVDIATPLGRGLTEAAALELGLPAGTPVGASLIDAHAGGLGSLWASGSAEGFSAPVTRQMAFVMGTSACSMAVTTDPVFVDGIWGPYFGAMLPGYWLNEGGQSAYGAALDHLVALHPAFPTVTAEAGQAGTTVLDTLESHAVAIAGSFEEAARLSTDIHIVPEFLGNRAPEADPAATAVLSGLTLDTSREGLVRQFVAGLCGLSYGTAQILDALASKGVMIDTIVVSGGASRSALLRRILSDATRRRVAVPETPEPVLLGAAMMGAVASGAFAGLAQASAAMCRTGESTEPADGAMREFHAAKRRAYDLLQRCEREVRRAMGRVEGL